jgi:dihydrofolate reductase
MNKEHSNVVLYISISLDGYIATPDDDLSWLSMVQQEGEDYGYGAMQERCSAYIIGRKTYEVVLGLTGGQFPQSELFDCYVITREARAPENGVSFYKGPIEDLVNRLKAETSKDIYCDGGAEIVKLLLEKDLIDEYLISVIPILLGDGKRLFKGGLPKKELKALPSRYFDSGLVQLHYVKKA